MNQAESLAFIKSLKKSVNTVIGEKAINLSGGQAQRLGIARSIFHKPELLILDEAFSGIDNFTEKKIVKIFNSRTRVDDIENRTKCQKVCQNEKEYRPN